MKKWIAKNTETKKLSHNKRQKTFGTGKINQKYSNPQGLQSRRGLIDGFLHRF